ncbi:hypothetical protein P7H55_00180 [Vagococcus lutrae]|uniref:hypothetical protein n=1 Tax=Vagococcus lutrae TaxID=81947 RepID=UPI0028927D47|nr:hypothetical protein [Vagococcus lutrae]MDT2816272.1 hypothetical protein [Vagococcus lutrae]
MTYTLIEVPTINDEREDYISLLKIYNSSVESKYNEVVFDFTNCRFLRQNGVAFLGGLFRYLNYRGKEVKYIKQSIEQRIFTNLQQNGFAGVFFDDSSSWDGNSIPYYEFKEYSGIETYLKDKWLGKGWINMSQKLQDAIVARVFEIYVNSVEHADSKIGSFSCGQHFVRNNELCLSLVDFGVGVAEKVKNHLSETEGKEITSLQAMEWAFTEGNSTRDYENIGYSGGMGLSMIKEFLMVNGGNMSIYCNDCHLEIDENDMKISTIDYNFPGTMICIKIKKDDSFYDFK